MTMLDSETRSTTPARVLFVDDSRLMRFAGQRFLGSDFDVVTAENGRQAWERILADDSIRVVFTDLVMPDMDGHELIRRARASRDARIRQLPILVITGTDEDAERKRALHGGATDLIPKPFSNSDLTEPARLHTRAIPAPPVPNGREAILPNVEGKRRQCVGRIDQALSFHRRHGLELALIHVRLDNHDRITAEHGPAWADSMLRHVGRTLAREVRKEDTVCRSGDNIFTIVLMATHAPGARVLCDRLRGNFGDTTVRFPGRSLEMAVSFSVQALGSQLDIPAGAILEKGLARLAEPANVTRLSDRRAPCG